MAWGLSCREMSRSDAGVKGPARGIVSATLGPCGSRVQPCGEKMSRRAPPSSAVDLQALPPEISPDATCFIRISGPPRRPPPAPLALVAGAPPPLPPVQQSLPPQPPSIRSGVRIGIAPTGPGAHSGSIREPRSVQELHAPIPTDSPFQVKVVPATHPAGTESRLYATVVAGCTAVCVGLMAVVCAAVDPGPSMADDASGRAMDPVLSLRSGELEDTGSWFGDDDGDEAGTRVSGAGSSISAGSSKPVVAPRPTAAVGGVLTIQLPDPRGITSIAVSCPSGFTGRSPYGQAPYVIDGVPGERCTLWFRGASPYKFVGVSGGQSLTCDFPSGVAWCE